MNRLGIVSPSKAPAKLKKQTWRVVEKLKRQIVKSQQPHEFASLATDYDEFRPHQKLLS